MEIHTLGYPRIGTERELKKALEAYWQGKISPEDLEKAGQELRHLHWEHQKDLGFVTLGDFSFYDQMLDMSFTLGNLPSRAENYAGSPLDNYFRVARGRSAPGTEGIPAAEMTKWFNTNYHYIVPEFTADTRFSLDTGRLVTQIREAKTLGYRFKPVIIGPLTYLALGKSKDGSDPLALLDRLIPVYRSLLDALAAEGAEWVQIDEPLLVTDLEPTWKKAYVRAYADLGSRVKILLATYFGSLGDNCELAMSLPVPGLHVDAVAGSDDLLSLARSWGGVLSLGIINGRNVWKSDLNGLLDQVEPLKDILGDRLWLAPSCSLLHVPLDLRSERDLNPEVKAWLAFARQKLEELQVLAKALSSGRRAVEKELEENLTARELRRRSVRNPGVQAALQALESEGPRAGDRKSPYAQRAAVQQEILKLPLYPTTTIGSFPQTPEIRQARRLFKSGAAAPEFYRDRMREEIARCIRVQEDLGLDVLVHGEPERNDMVEYFGEQLEGFIFTQNAWVQSYGSRCVKPPILFGDVQRKGPMTLEWITYAQSLTGKPVKGMLTGPVTILNWSFVRDDQSRELTCRQIALAVRQEVRDLEKAGVRIIQIDEAALREGLPVRRSQWSQALAWGVEAYRIAANGVEDGTQIHTHMCYSEFNQIMDSIAAMDADVITIETSRSGGELLDGFKDRSYPNAIGPGVYDIHSPNIPSPQDMEDLLTQASKRLPPQRLWVNPDCGLKTRRWEEVVPALKAMVAAAQAIRKQAEELLAPVHKI